MVAVTAVIFGQKQEKNVKVKRIKRVRRKTRPERNKELTKDRPNARTKLQFRAELWSLKVVIFGKGEDQSE